MKKIIEYIKKLKPLSKILIGVWMFCIFVVTYGCAISTEGNLTFEDIAVLIIGYIVFSNFFLVPAIAYDTFIKAKQRERDEFASDKSWGVSFLLCFFFWRFGLHRFYAGKKTSGIFYFFTAAYFGMGYIIDLILILSGKFTDKAGKPIKYNKQNNKTSIYTKRVSDEINGYKESLSSSLTEIKTKLN